MEPFSSSATAIPSHQSLSNAVASCDSADNLVSIFETATSSRANEFYDVLTKNTELQKKIKSLFDTQRLPNEKAKKIETICQLALGQTKKKETLSKLESIMNFCETSRYLPLTDENLAAAVEDGLKHKNGVLLGECSRYISKECGLVFAFDYNNDGKNYKNVIEINGKIKPDRLSTIYAKVGNHLAADWQLLDFEKYPELAFLKSKPLEVLAILGPKFQSLSLADTSHIDEIIVACPNLKTLYFNDLKLTEGVIEKLSSLKNISITLNWKYKNETPKELISSLLKLGSDGKSLFLNITDISDHLWFEDIDPQKPNYKQDLEKRVRFFLITFAYSRKEYTLGGEELKFVMNGLNEQVTKDIHEIWLSNLNDPLFINNSVIYSWMKRRATTSPAIEAERDAILARLNSEPLNVNTIRMAMFCGFLYENSKLIENCLTFINTNCGFSFGPFGVFINENWNANNFTEISPFVEEMLNGQTPIETNQKGKNLREIYEILGTKIETITLTTVYPLSVEDFKTVLSLTPNLKTIVLAQDSITEEHLEAIENMTQDVKVTIDSSDKPHLRQVLLKAVIKGFKFDSPPEFTVADFEQLDDDFIKQHSETCLDLYLNIDSETPIPSRLLNESNIIRFLEKHLIKKASKHLAQVKDILQKKFKKADENSSDLEAASKLYSLIYFASESPIYPDTRNVIKELFKLLPPQAIENKASLLDVINVFGTIPNGMALGVLNKTIQRIKAKDFHVGLVDQKYQNLIKLCSEEIKQNHGINIYFNKDNIDEPYLEVRIHSKDPNGDIINVIKEISQNISIALDIHRFEDIQEVINVCKAAGKSLILLDLFIQHKKFTDQQLSEIVTSCPNLSEFKLKEADEITTNGLENIKSLRNLTLNKCPKLVRLPTNVCSSIKKLRIAETPFDFASLNEFNHLEQLDIVDYPLGFIAFPQLKQHSINCLVVSNSRYSTLEFKNLEIFKLIVLLQVNIPDLSPFLNHIDSGQFSVSACTFFSNAAQKQLLGLLLQGKKIAGVEQKYFEPQLIREEFRKPDLTPEKVLILLRLIGNDRENLRLFLPVVVQTFPDIYEKRYLGNASFKEIVNKLFPITDAANAIYYPVESAEDFNNHINIKALSAKALRDPYAVLRALARHNKIPGIKIQYLDQPNGVDASGLSRQMISQIFQGLSDATTPQFMFESQKDKRYLPIAKTVLNSNQQIYLETIGKLLALAAGSGQKLLVGDIFPECFFLAMTKLNEEELNTDISPRRLVELYEALISHPVEKENLAYYKGILRLSPDQELTDEQIEFLDGMSIDHGKTITDKVRNELIHDFVELMKSKVIPLQLIARGFAESLPVQFQQVAILNWSIFKDIPPDQLQTLIQGVISKEAFLEKVEVSLQQPMGIGLTDEEREIQSKHMEDVRSWIVEWVQKHSVDELKNVVRGITGGASIALPLKFKLVDGVSGMMAHTCFNLVDIPLSFDKDRFMEQMDEWGAGKGIGMFNRA